MPWIVEEVAELWKHFCNWPSPSWLLSSWDKSATNIQTELNCQNCVTACAASTRTQNSWVRGCRSTGDGDLIARCASDTAVHHNRTSHISAIMASFSIASRESPPSGPSVSGLRRLQRASSVRSAQRHRGGCSVVDSRVALRRLERRACPRLHRQRRAPVGGRTVVFPGPPALNRHWKTFPQFTSSASMRACLKLQHHTCSRSGTNWKQCVFFDHSVIIALNSTPPVTHTQLAGHQTLSYSRPTDNLGHRWKHWL